MGPESDFSTLPSAPVTLKLDDDTRKALEQIMIQRCRDAVAGAQQRDADIADFDDQLEGRLQPIQPRWKNACTLNDPLSREAHLELLSLVNQSFSKTPLCLVEAVNPQDEDKATKIEQWLVDKGAAYNIRKRLYDWAYNAAGRDDTAIMYVGWKQTVKTTRRTMYKPLSDSADESGLVSAEERIPGNEYEEHPVQYDEMDQQGCDIRVVDLGDFYLYPPNAQSIDSAIAVGERVLYSAYDLQSGIEAFGFDEEAVETLIARGPTHLMDAEGMYRERQDAYDGTSGDIKETADGHYECYLLFGRLPVGNDNLNIPAHFEGAEVMVVLCPAQEIVLNIELSPYANRPYIANSILPKPGRFRGTGGMRLLATLQDEANANLQSTIDAINIEMSPTMIASANWLSRYSNRFSVYPGAILPDDDESANGLGLRALQWQRNSTLGMELQEQIVSRGKGLVAAEGYGQLDPKQRKNGEMQNVMSAADSKFDLFLTNFMFGVEELFARIVALHAQFDPDMSDLVTMGGKQEKVSLSDMSAEFRYIPSATSNTATPQMRLQIAQAKVQLQQQWFMGKSQLQPQDLPLLWHSLRQVLIDMGERQPESILGPEPQAPPPVPMQIQQLVAQGMPPQMALAMLAGQQQPQGQPQAPGQAPGQGAGVPQMFLQGQGGQ